MKRKVLSLGIVCLLVFSVCGCQTDFSGRDIIRTETDPEISAISGNDLTLTDIPDQAQILCSCDGSIFYTCFDEGETEQLSDEVITGRQHMYRYDASQGGSEYVADLGQVFSRTGDALYRGGKIYYPCITGSTQQFLLEIEPDTGQVRELMSADRDNVFSYIRGTDDDIFLFSINALSADETEYIVERILPDTAETETVIRKSAGTAEGEGDGEAAEGTSISCVDTHGESIYTYEVTFDGGRGKDISTVNRYTGAGKLTDSYTLDGFDAFLEPGSEQKQDDSSASEASPEGAASASGVSGEQNASPEQGASAESAGQPENFRDTVWSINVHDGYILLNTINSRHAIYKIEEDKLIRVESPEELSKDVSGDYQYASGYRSGEDQIFFAACFLSERNLCLFDPDTLTFGWRTIPAGRENCTYAFHLSDKGDLIIQETNYADQTQSSVCILDRRAMI